MHRQLFTKFLRKSDVLPAGRVDFDALDYDDATVDMAFWDADLDEFLARVPPHLMNQGYWSKGLVRGKLARRFPAAGFDKQLKVLSTTLSTEIMARETPGAWAAMGGVESLAGGGIVDKILLQSDVERRVNVIKRPEGVEGQETYERAIAAHGIWTVLNVESWLRQWV